MAHKSYEESKKGVYRGLILLAGVTLVEVIFSLLGKGHIIDGAENWRVLVIIAALAILVLSVYKAYFIVYQFMHMAHEVKGLARTVLLPMLLLIWAMIAFFAEGSYWKKRRGHVENKTSQTIKENSQMGMIDLRELKKEDFQ